MDNSVENMEIRLLEREKWRGFVLDMDYVACERYETRVSDGKDGSSIILTRRKLSSPESHTSKQYDYPDKLYQDHFPGARAYGFVENGRLAGVIELYAEEWANRLRVTELWVRADVRRRGLGGRLMDFAKAEARRQGRRMIILETQTCNVNAIDFYRRNGFVLAGVLLADYSNNDPGRGEVRLEMGYYLT